jgi:(p)ppGpp synthase/HD superfamily hydrolase
VGPPVDGVFVATIEVVAIDRSRLLADVTRVVSEHHLNIVAPTPRPTPTGSAGCASTSSWPTRPT